MTLIWRPGILYDADALAYMELVKAADAAAGQTGGLEQGVIDAINDFVVGCKTDGIWSAIKASCILAGARTLAGALQPLAGTAPTNFNFVSGDYNRKTGLVNTLGASYLNSNRASNVDPQNNMHVSAYSSSIFSSGFLFGSAATGSSMDMLGFNGVNTLRTALHSGIADTTIVPSAGLHGLTRDNGSSYLLRQAGSQIAISTASASTVANNMFIFTRNFNGGPNASTTGRLAFYSIGESLNLALLDARVTALITAFGVAIP